jgi:hypothetical protein
MRYEKLLREAARSTKRYPPTGTLSDGALYYRPVWVDGTAQNGRLVNAR